MGSSGALAWVTAIGSAGSLLGFASYVWVMLLNRRDEADVRQEEQAQGVSAWMDEGRRHDREEDYVICVHNNGAAPVFKCRVEFSLPDDGREGTLELAILPPHVTAVRALPFDYDDLDVDQLYSAAAVPELTFLDSHGRHWQRDVHGQLARFDRYQVRRRPRLRRGSRHRD